jgi:DNA-binding transcriptional MocR family regulator
MPVREPRPPVEPPPSRGALRARLVEDVRARIAGGALPPGAALPSVRALARERGISAFTAAEVYNVLVATGLIEARRGRGYFVAGVPAALPVATRAGATADALWERRLEARAQPILVDAGGGWLPAGWQYGEGIRAALRAQARLPLPAHGYGSPAGLEALRAHFATQLRARGLGIGDDALVLTQGASQALDLIVRTLLEPGDTVAVEDPGYPPTLELLRARGVKLQGVPRLPTGPDVEVLAALARRRSLAAFFTNTTLHNPTGTTTELPVARRVLELAEQHGFRVIEDDIFADLAPTPPLPLAALDQCRRVVYVSSVSKTIAPSLRVGYAAASPEVARRLARTKVLSALASSELVEQLVLGVLTLPHYRRHLETLRRRLAQSQQRVQEVLLSRGAELAFRPAAGLFLWGRLRSRDSVSRLWRSAAAAGVLLAPGELFRPDGRATPYWRFNVAQSDADELARFLDALASRERRRGTP